MAPIKYLFSSTVLLLIVASIVSAVTTTATTAATTKASCASAPRGIRAVLPWGEGPALASTWTLPFVEGIVLRLYWKDFYSGTASTPATGGSSSASSSTTRVLNTTLLDAMLAQAAMHNSSVRFMVAPGFYSPDFVLNDTRIQFGRGFTVPQGPWKGQTGHPLPLPWDPVYLQYWKDFVETLSAKYGGNRLIPYVSCTGPNSHNGEVSLPREHSDIEAWRRIAKAECAACRTIGDKRWWLAQKLLGAWKQAVGIYNATFGALGTPFTIAIIDMPVPIGHKNKSLQDWYMGAIADVLIANNNQNSATTIVTTHPSRISTTEAAAAAATPAPSGLQCNGLDGRSLCPTLTQVPYQWQLIHQRAAALRNVVGFQTRQPNNLLKCSGVDAAQVVQQTVDNGLSRGGRFLEIYEGECHNSTLVPILAAAAQKLGC